MKPLRIHYLQHVHFEDPVCISNWAIENGHKLSSTKFHENEPVPELADFDWLIVMGGPMGVYDSEKYDWINPEKAFIAQAIREGKTVLGICLGAQLIAAALGAKVYPNTEKEIGWFPISLTQESILGNAGDRFPVMHWHGDTFDLPQGATRIASSEACINQAFIYSEKVIGLQFHLELTELAMNRMILNCGEELVKGNFIQTAEEIKDSTAAIGALNQRMYDLLNKLQAI